MTSPHTDRMTKIMLSMPPDLLRQVDDAAARSGVSRSQLVRESLTNFLVERDRLLLRQRLAEGYEARAARDLDLAAAFRAAEDDVVARDVPLYGGARDGGA